MECSICHTRSSEGFCAICKTLLCEECGTRCEQCGKMVCPSHVEETSSGRLLCSVCYEERRERRKKRKKKQEAAEAGVESTSFEALQGEEGQGEEEDVVDETEALATREPIAPWKMSFIVSAVGLVLILVFLFLPATRRLPLGIHAYFPVPIVGLLIPLLAILWAYISLRKFEYQDRRIEAMLAMVCALLVLIGITGVVVADFRQAAQEKAAKKALNNVPPEVRRARALDRYRK